MIVDGLLGVANDLVAMVETSGKDNGGYFPNRVYLFINELVGPAHFLKIVQMQLH